MLVSQFHINFVKKYFLNVGSCEEKNLNNDEQKYKDESVSGLICQLNEQL